MLGALTMRGKEAAVPFRVPKKGRWERLEDRAVGRKATSHPYTIPRVRTNAKDKKQDRGETDLVLI